MTFRIAFVCTGNSCRSQIGEALLTARAAALGLDVAGCSAGTAPADRVHATAVAALASRGLAPVSNPKPLSALPSPVDLAITVCDEAAESCPLLTTARAHAHWGLPDPANEPDAVAGHALAMRIGAALAGAIDALLDLPLAELEPNAVAESTARLAPNL